MFLDDVPESGVEDVREWEREANQASLVVLCADWDDDDDDIMMIMTMTIMMMIISIIVMRIYSDDGCDDGDDCYDYDDHAEDCYDCDDYDNDHDDDCW